MTNYLVNSPRTLLTGTNSNDLFDLRTAAAVSLYGIDGNDQFLAQGADNANAALLNGGLGDDTFGLNGLLGAKLSVIGGSGQDVISGNLTSLNYGLLQGDEGDDTIAILTASGDNITINGNGGRDFISYAANMSASRLLGGGDSDTINFTSEGMSSTTIQGGGGSDIISGYWNNFSDKMVIAGDTELVQGIFDGNDTINLLLRGEGMIDGLVQGNGGNDLITLDRLSRGMTVGGNSGNDTIKIEGNASFATATRAAINLGAGNDVFSGKLDSNANISDLSINGGGGQDSIYLSGNSAASAAFSAFFFGGDGADYFELRGEAFGASAGGQVAYANAAQSNLSAVDTIWAQVGAGGVGSSNTTGYRVFVDYINLFTGETANSTTITISGTEAIFTSTFALGATARVAALNAYISEAGSTVFFADGLGNDLIFVQGGASGSSDDLLVKNATAGITAMTITARGPGLMGGTIAVEIS